MRKPWFCHTMWKELRGRSDVQAGFHGALGARNEANQDKCYFY